MDNASIVREVTQPQTLRSLVERSIAAWKSMDYAIEDMDKLIEQHSGLLRGLESVDELIDRREYWFFQRREHFMTQPRLSKWDMACLDSYVLLPIDYGFVNNQDCFFISHYWRTRAHPDPEGTDVSGFRDDLRGQDWQYVWVDWTCMPQVPRSRAEDSYFRKMLRSIPLLIQDCAFEWRFPAFEPRAWVLFEVGVWLLNHEHSGLLCDDMKPLAVHVEEMVRNGVVQTMQAHGYRCTNEGDLRLVSGWLEILTILFRAIPDVQMRQETMSSIYSPFVGSFVNVAVGLRVDKAAGTITVGETVHTFTPVFHLTPD